MKQLTIIGHLGGDAVTKEVNGNSFASFSIAVNEKYKKSDGTEMESTTWFTCTTKKIKLTQFLKKGDRIMVQGNFKTTVYQDRDRNWKSGIDIHASNIQLLSERRDDEKEQGFEVLRRIVREEVNRQPRVADFQQV